jgi:hypothetical protein
MKKLLILVLSIMLVAGSFAAVYASDGGMDSVRSAVEGSKVIIGGDARVRGVCKYNYDTNDDVDDDDCYWDQRLRLNITGQITGGVEVRVRLNAGETTWGTGSGTFGSDEDSTVTTDYAYIHIPIGPVFVDVGQMPYSWGNKFLVWDERVDRLAIHGHSGDVTVGVFGDKLDDNQAGPDGFLNNDVDQYGITAVYSANDAEAGAIVVFVRDDLSLVDNDGYYGSIYANATVSGVNVMAEVAVLGGDRFETAGEEDNPWGGFISAEMGMDALTVGLLGAITQNTYSADSHFTPTVFIGTDNPAAMSDFGALGDSLLIVGSVEFAATPELDVYGKLAYADYEPYPSGSDFNAFEVDAGLTFDVANNTTYSIDVGYLSPDDFSAQDDGAIAVLSKVQVYF